MKLITQIGHHHQVLTLAFARGWDSGGGQLVEVVAPWGNSSRVSDKQLRAKVTQAISLSCKGRGIHYLAKTSCWCSGGWNRYMLLPALLEFFEKVQDSPIFILYSSIGLLWTLARDFFKTRTKNTLRLAGLKAKVYTFMLYGMW